MSSSEKDRVIDTLKADMLQLKTEIVQQNDLIKQLKCTNQHLQSKLKQSEKDFQAVVAALCERDLGAAHTKRREVKHHMLHSLLVKSKHAEEVAECLRKELDAVKFNAKTLRLQEVQMECREHFSEVVLLREKLATLLKATNSSNQFSSSVALHAPELVEPSMVHCGAISSNNQLKPSSPQCQSDSHELHARKLPPVSSEESSLSSCDDDDDYAASHHKSHRPVEHPPGLSIPRTNMQVFRT